ncbi:MAG: hypothetical protein AVDCRST_MAG69-135, partial [uncultured Solirubrobacteraceae bacterium]
AVDHLEVSLRGESPHRARPLRLGRARPARRARPPARDPAAVPRAAVRRPAPRGDPEVAAGREGRLLVRPRAVGGDGPRGRRAARRRGGGRSRINLRRGGRRCAGGSGRRDDRRCGRAGEPHGRRFHVLHL